MLLFFAGTAIAYNTSDLLSVIRNDSLTSFITSKSFLDLTENFNNLKIFDFYSNYFQYIK